MATAGENAWQDTAGAAAEKLAEAAAAAGEALGEEKLEAEGGAGEGNEWSLLTRALVSVVAIAVCFLLVKVIRGESPEDRRQRLRNERRVKKQASGGGPDEIDKLLSSIVRRQPGQAPPPGTVPLSGPGRGGLRGMPPGGAGRGAGAAAAKAGAGAAVGAAGRGNGAGRGPPPPGAVDNRPKLRWDQSNEEVEIVIRVDPKVMRSDVKVEVTGTMLKLNLRNQAVIAGHLFKSVDPEGCTWQIDNPGPGQSKEVTITLLKAEPASSRDQWWRAPLKGLENRGPVRRPSQQPADPEMVRKAIEAIKAKSAAGAGGKPGVKLGAKVSAAAAAGQQAAAASAAAGTSTTPGGSSASNGASAASATTPAAAAATAVGGAAPTGKDAMGAATATPASPAGATPATAPTKAGKSGGKKKNRKKK